ncbi:hypothetical protein PSN45_003333 [Yamadazyma tenuis]|uniref:Uncharacterized protein n=1 Tax=Candida tenuis (strain ATCC 10573 / BCRC 21748 / CBS 615 / JCM 9827 / NBRC 10315 / NRRL Y-1498 / VKM Y-70) TaxID=590646 RepID=G3AYJ2_CANTC|nr:uncharacterized protein CANTEDRAFT_92204 [Yamadazyma tenuis ATCC 10573]EGV65865.1 hypothetical protein CANTEDRAFT_92204 [Yamadazyma tenuis ATCC 10573]WEJ95806.1 hypothetical protein PSN45_003333 [Yamadazyma tenuis]
MTLKDNMETFYRKRWMSGVQSANNISELNNKIEDDLDLSESHQQSCLTEQLSSSDYYEGIEDDTDSSSRRSNIFESDTDANEDQISNDSVEMRPVMKFNEPDLLIEKLQKDVVKQVRSAMKVPEGNEHILNCSVNAILTDPQFRSVNFADPEGLKKGDEAAFNMILSCQLIDKYVDTKAGELYDIITGSLLFTGEQSGGATVEQPGWFSKYMDIWQFDGQQYDTFDQQTFQDYFMKDLYSSESFETLDVKKIADRIFLMNLQKFRFYFSKMPSKINVCEIDLEELDDDDSKDELEVINKRNLNSFVSQRKSQVTVKFTQDPETIIFEDMDPPESISLNL